MDLRRLARELELTRKDRIGIIVLAVLVILSIYLPTFVHRDLRDHRRDADTSWMAAFRNLETDSAEGSGYRSSAAKNYNNRSASYKPRELTPFEFDPNQATAEELEELGLPEKTIRTLLNFRGKGGKFRKKEDLKKVYGLRPEHYEILEPFIRIPQNQAPYLEKDRIQREKPVRGPLPFDINLADTTVLMALPGIGPRLSQRIVAFREKLGGFYTIDQLREVYGLADSVFRRIAPYLLLGETNVRKININTATEEELRSHPYIRFQLARPIIAYRTSHGNFRTLDELRNIMAITSEIFEKLKPYLSISP